ncbi:MAG: hypothetical protein K2H47_08865 [Muribaculaceae bacterium]|nr:hypothetical protein [Muribaculaceae bacterium]
MNQKQLSILYSIETSRLRESIKIGEEQQLHSTVIKLRSKGLTDDMISNLLNIPLEEIADIR